jgi:hypothetical protein
MLEDLAAAGGTIRLREPLAAFLGALAPAETVAYTFADVVKLAGHACPTTAAAFVACRAGLSALYPDAVPVRGDVTVTVDGGAVDGSLGVTALVFQLLTGAAPATGFKGLGGRYRRKDLLAFDPAAAGSEGVSLRLERTDTGRAVRLRILPRSIPFAPEKAARMGSLMERALWDAASEAEAAEFRALWVEKVLVMLADGRAMLEDGRPAPAWLEVTEVGRDRHGKEA